MTEPEPVTLWRVEGRERLPEYVGFPYRPLDIAWLAPGGLTPAPGSEWALDKLANLDPPPDDSDPLAVYDAVIAHVADDDPVTTGKAKNQWRRANNKAKPRKTTRKTTAKKQAKPKAPRKTAEKQTGNRQRKNLPRRSRKNGGAAKPRKGN